MSRILIRGATIITMESTSPVPPIENGAIAIEGNTLAYAGPLSGLPADFQPDQTIDATGMLALPGLVNCHTHAAMTLLRSYADDMPLMSWLNDKIWPLEANLERDDIYWGTMLACLEMIKSGTTCFADMYFHMRRAGQAALDAGMRASIARGMIGTAPNSEEALAYSRELVQSWQGQGDGRITVTLGPHAPYTCPPAYLEKVVRLAHDLNVGIHIHLAETRDEINMINQQYGQTPIALMEQVGLFERPVLAAHCVHLTEADIEILVRRRVGIAHNPQSNMKLASGIAPVEKLRRAGAIVGIGTDGAASNNNLDMFEEMRTAALLQKVSTGDPTALPAYAALYMATAGGAAALGLEGRVGRLQAGLRADLILLNTRVPHLCPPHDWYAHLVYAAGAADVDTVIIDGRLVMQNRQVLTVEEEKVYAEVTQRANRLVAAAQK
ncbi:MAG: amidohydrolase [Bacillota bacterium]